MEEDSRLRKRHRIGDDSITSSTSNETSSRSNIMNPISAPINAQMVTTGDNLPKHTLLEIRYPNMKFLQPVGLSRGLALLWKDGFICDVPWVLLGDLNFHILDCSSTGSSSGDGLVNSIINEVSLQDLGFIGREHTWSNNNMGTGIKISRLDMAFVNGSWNQHFQDCKLIHLQHSGSDHCPIMLVTDYSQPKLWKPFKFFKTWLQDKTCAAEIAKAWEKSVQGSEGYRLIKRLQFTRITLSRWNKTHFGNIDQNVDFFQQKLSEIQALPFSQDNTAKAIEVNRELDKWHKIQQEFYKQRSRDNFVKEMDYNTKYFHTLTKRKRARNNIDSLKTKDGSWLHSRKDISVLLTQHLKKISTSQDPSIEEHHYIHIPTLISEEDNRLLLLPPSNEEIYKILKSMESWSAQGLRDFKLDSISLGGILLVLMFVIW
ncbi:uncharacterized protein LOC113273054 [Papaver somniferum]|uniref:uncharacterized protein LOC113273054 n=1 Tax=Papaver somniferum TaxID=3469 RepID=UPI000E6F61C1|nr:uncharacterized protein LOC113273054 [Papaver somniferum]